MIVSEQLNYIKTRRFHAIFMPVIIEFSRCIGTYSSAKFELCIKIFSELQLKNRTDMVSILAIWGIVAFCQKNVMGQFTTIFTYNSFSVEKRWMEDVKNRYNIPSDSSYCILIKEENDPGYIYYLGKYVFQSNDFKTVLNATEDSINSTGQANYILTYDKENQVIQDWVKLNYPNQAGNDVIIRE